jgi:hypothetical protein
VNIGDKVKYSRAFLRSTGMLTGEAPFGKGTITALDSYGSKDFTIATIQWDGGFDLPGRVNVKNLILVSKIHLEVV